MQPRRIDEAGPQTVSKMGFVHHYLQFFSAKRAEYKQ